MTNEQRELVERLRNSSNSMHHDAADLIEQLAERCETYKELLVECGRRCRSPQQWNSPNMADAIDAALKEGT